MSAASQTYINVLTPGVSYVAESGTVYPALQLTEPSLTIGLAGSQVVLTWPVTTPAYRLLQNNDLTTTNWVPSTNAVTVVNGTNQVSMAPTGTSMYFLLISP
jgi:hypothetical protein